MHSLFGSVAFLACIGWACGEPAPYLRATDDESGGRILQVAARTLVSPKEDGPRVTLLGVSHLGDAAYYEKIQKKLDESTDASEEAKKAKKEQEIRKGTYLEKAEKKLKRAQAAHDRAQKALKTDPDNGQLKEDVAVASDAFE